MFSRLKSAYVLTYQIQTTTKTECPGDHGPGMSGLGRMQHDGRTYIYIFNPEYLLENGPLLKTNRVGTP